MKRTSIARHAMAVALKRVSLRLGGRTVLRSIDWRVEPYQRWVLLGENGAGKTQLLKLLAGDVWPTPTRGALRRYEWRGVQQDEPYELKAEIAYLGAERQDRYEHYQWNLRVREMVGTGLYRTDIPLDPLTLADRRKIQTLLTRLGLAGLAARRFLTLSYGQRRLVLLARALAARPSLLLLDEALDGLDAAHRVQLSRVVTQVSRGPLPWVMSTHREEEIPREATHLLNLRSGRVVWQGPIRAWRKRRPGARAATRIRQLATRAARRTATRAVELITLHNAWVWLDGSAVLRRLDFTVRSGDCWVIHGGNGSGKSTLTRALYGDLGAASQGSIRRHGIEAGVAIGEFKRRVGWVAPELQMMHPLTLNVLDVVVSGLHSSIGLDQQPTAAERRSALRALRALGAAALAARTLRALSYGQLRRVLFARALVHEPDILLLDEPYTGLDSRTRAALQSWVEDAALRGKTILLTTHHRDEWPRSTTHELQLESGRAVYTGVRRTRA